MLAPFLPIILDAAALTSGEAVLDVGCGCGATTHAAARAVAPALALGADLSTPMLDRARADAAQAGIGNVEFVQADVQVHPFDPASFDVVISRFGVMFFADPVAAFANVRRALRPDGRMVFACWQHAAGNPWFGLPRSAALEHVPRRRHSPRTRPDRSRSPTRIGPGCCCATRDGATSNSSRTRRRCCSAVPVRSKRRSSSSAPDRWASRCSRTSTPPPRPRALDAVRAALTPFVEPDGVRMPAAIWLVTARR